MTQPLLPNDVLERFNDWMILARDKELNDANAMSLATLDSETGFPSVRMVLLKGVDERGFVFYTNTTSRKGNHLAKHPKAALGFHWKSIRKQVRVEGQVQPVTDAEADAYFASRARVSQLGAWASQQSQPLEHRQVFEQAVQEVTERFEGQDVPRPPLWSGFRIHPHLVEFWEDREFRLHDRDQYQLVNGQWRVGKLYP